MKSVQTKSVVLVNVDKSLIEYARRTPITEAEFYPENKISKKLADGKTVFSIVLLAAIFEFVIFWLAI